MIIQVNFKGFGQKKDRLFKIDLLLTAKNVIINGILVVKYILTSDLITYAKI